MAHFGGHASRFTPYGWTVPTQAQEKQMADARDLALKVKAIDRAFKGSRFPFRSTPCNNNDFDGRAAREEASLARSEEPAVYNNFALFYREMGEPARAIAAQASLVPVSQGNENHFLHLAARTWR